MVAGRLSAADCERGYILDGFPRTLAQAAWLDDHLAEGNACPVVAISLTADRDDLLKRITGRRICPQRAYLSTSIPNHPAWQASATWMDVGWSCARTIPKRYSKAE